MLIERLATGQIRSTAFVQSYGEPLYLRREFDKARALSQTWLCSGCCRETREVFDALYYDGPAGCLMCFFCQECDRSPQEERRARAIARIESRQGPPKLTLIEGGAPARTLRGETRE